MMNRVSNVVPSNCRPDAFACKPNMSAYQTPVSLTSQDTVRFSGLSGRTGRAAFLALALMPLMALAGCGINSTEQTTIQQVDQSTQNDEQAKLLSAMLRQKGTWQGRTEGLKRFNMLNQPAAVKMPAYLNVAEQLYESSGHLNHEQFLAAEYLHTGLLATARHADTSKEHSAQIIEFVANIPLMDPSNNKLQTPSASYKALKETLQKAFPAPAESGQ